MIAGLLRGCFVALLCMATTSACISELQRLETAPFTETKFGSVEQTAIAFDAHTRSHLGRLSRKRTLQVLARSGFRCLEQIAEPPRGETSAESALVRCEKQQAYLPYQHRVWVVIIAADDNVSGSFYLLGL